MKELKNPISIRGDNLYCPLPLSLESYWNCEIDCHHCYFRRLNATWGKEMRVTNPMKVYKKLKNSQLIKSPKSQLAIALKNKKTIRLGNKADPFQPIEKKLKISLKLIRILIKLKWSFVIQTRITKLMMEYKRHIIKASKDHPNLITVMPIVSPGLEKDWEVFEKKLTTPPLERIKHAHYLRNKRVRVGINGEPFIPGFHTEKDFEDTIKLLKKHKINRYNTYNFHFNSFVAKRLNKIGVDIEKIWYYNQDKRWKMILFNLCEIAKKYNIILGCPDFVNTGLFWIEKANTCCGIDVPNPCTFNTHYWKKIIQEGNEFPNYVLMKTYEGIGDYKLATDIVSGNDCDFYTMRDAGVLL